MKTMRKTVAALLLMCFSLFAFSGCSPEAKSFFAETQKTNEWNGMTTTGHMNLQVNTQNMKFNVPMDIKMDIANIKSGTPLMHYIVKIGDISDVMKVLGLGDNIKIPEIEYYFDLKSQKIAFNKSFMTDLAKQAKEELPPEMKNIKEDYIGFSFEGESGSLDMSKLADPSYNARLMKVFEETFEGVDGKAFEITKKGNTYHYEANSDQLVEGFEKGLNAIVKNWDKIGKELEPIFQAMQVAAPTSDLKDLKVQLNKPEFKKNLEEAKKVLTGSKIAMDTTFEKDKMIQNMDLLLNIQVPAEQGVAPQSFAFGIKADLTSVRNEKLAITMPQAHYFKDADLMSLFAAGKEADNSVLVLINDDVLNGEAIISNNRTLVPYRAFAEQIGAKVEWNGKTRQVTVSRENAPKVVLTIGSKTVMIGDKKVTIDVAPEIHEGHTYVPVRVISEAFNYNVKWDGENRIVEIQSKDATNKAA